MRADVGNQEVLCTAFVWYLLSFHTGLCPFRNHYGQRITPPVLLFSRVLVQ